MTVYTWLVVLLLLAAFFFQGNLKGNRRFIFVAFLLLFAYMGLRNADLVGSDAAGIGGSYPVIYRINGTAAWGEIVGKGGGLYNIGFAYFSKLIYLLTDGNYQSYITIISLFVVYSYMRFIRKYSPSPIQSVLYMLGLLYYTMLSDLLKQAIAMSVLLYAFDAIMEERPFKFAVIVIIAGLFHFPALVFLPAYWLSRMRVGGYYLVLLGGLLIVTYLFRDQILNLMLDAYLGDEGDASMEGIRFLRNKAIVMLVIVVAAIVLRSPTEDDKVYSTLLVFAGIAIVFQTFCGYNNIFERLADYYFHTSIVLLPLVFEKCDLKKHVLNPTDELSIKTFAPWVFCGFAIWRFLSYVNSSPAYSGFQFIWQ